ncbi:YdcF family protein [Pseudanabaena yagii]|uniref:YdcF family protein n=1 Tax=Pseudanabaena yagii GIHE-NHR1 TaxID=2722753 RepID=A0ABX1LWK0_9CYAN|nr:YdcF family protein [Pseudanabaena yagii]NMF60575.1 YdcF family protein [Pseudanabaena yagii GIHE-NHR1]
MEPLIFFAVIWLLWLISSRSWKRRFVLPLAIIGLLYLFITSPIMLALASQGLTFAIPQDSGENADAIVILGRGESLRSPRVDLGNELWQQKRAPKIFVSGMLDAQEIATHLKQKGVPHFKISGESCSQSTEENAQFTTALLYPQGIQKILLVTDVPHMLRSQILFQSYGFKVIPRMIPLPVQWSNNKQLKAVLREYAALIHYQWNGYLRNRTQEEIVNPSEKVSDRLKNWNCRINI